MTNRRGGLGRGLAALIPPSEDGSAGLAHLDVDRIRPNPRQPRTVFDDGELEELASSIRDLGLLQPVVVRPVGADRYELVAGERRLRAARLAGLHRIPAVLRDTDEDDLLKEALIENIHRVDLNPLEEAAAYRQLLDDFGVTQEQLAAQLGKSRPVISNALRLLTLAPVVQRRVAAGVLSAGHARALASIDDPALQERLAARAVQEGWTVRDTEARVRLALTGDVDAPRSRRRSATPTSGAVLELQAELSQRLAAPVRIRMGARRGHLRIDLRSHDELERIVGTLARGLEAGGAA